MDSGPDARCNLRARCEALYREHGDAIVRAVYARLRSWDESREVVQEAFLRIFRLTDPPAITHLRAYLYRTALNLAFDHRADRTLRQRGEDFIYTEVYSARVSENPTPEHVCCDEEMTALLQDAVDKLPDKTRTAFKLVELDHLSVEEASRKMGVAAMAVYQLVHRSYRIMARSLTRNDIAPVSAKRRAARRSARAPGRDSPRRTGWRG